MTKSKPDSLFDGIIEPDKLYTFRAIQRLTGVGRSGLREARKAGLEVRYFGRQGYVLGRWIIDHILEHGKTKR